MMDRDLPFDRRLRRLRRDRAAGRFADADYLHRLASDELLERLSSVKREFRNALLIGYPDDYLAAALRKRGIAVTAADPGDTFGRLAGIQCDEDALPIQDSAFELAISVGLLDSVNDLPGALILIRRALKPDGLFLGAFAGAGSLPRLKNAMLAADLAQGDTISPRIHPQIDVKAAGDLLTRAGFALPVADSDEVRIRFSHLIQLIRDLRGMGGSNILSSRSRLPILRSGLAAAIEDFAAASDPDGKTAELFNIIYVTGWSPAPDQPQPARRGSATRSLADALRPPG